MAATGESLDITKSLKAGWESAGERVKEICKGRKAIARSDPEFKQIISILLNEDSVTPSEIILQIGFNRVRASRVSESSETIYFLLSKEGRGVKIVKCGEDKDTEDLIVAIIIKVLVTESVGDSIFRIDRLPASLQAEFKFRDKVVDVKPQMLLAAGLGEHVVSAIKKEYHGLLVKIQNNGGTVAQIYHEGMESKEEEGAGRLIFDLPKLSDFLAKIKARGVFDGSTEEYPLLVDTSSAVCSQLDFRLSLRASSEYTEPILVLLD